MRELTIKRDKTFVACLAKMKVYIEDYTAQDLIINGTPCRKLGTLKNGEEKTFVIHENEAKVYVIADKLSKNFNNDYYTIPAGYEKIYLSGKNKYNPVTGNPFRFDGVANEDVVQNRKKGLRIGIIILAISAIIGFCIGFFGSFFDKPEPKVFTYDEFSITLTDEFHESEYEGYTTIYDSSKCAVFVLEEDIAQLVDAGALEKDASLEDYCHLLIDVNGLGEEFKPETYEDLMYFSYNWLNPETNKNYTYVSFVYETEDSFWLVQFTYPEEDASEIEPTVLEWAKSVTLS